jgi:CRP-like cAMP-binding protein
MAEDSKEVWKSLDQIFETKEYKEWPAYIQEMLKGQIQFEDLARSCKTLFDLHLMNSKDSGKKKAFGYAMLTAYCYMHMKRMAPAMTTVDAMKKAVAPEDMTRRLEEDIARHFSNLNSQEEQSPTAESAPEDAAQIKEEIEAEFKGEHHFDSHIEDFPLFSDLPYKEVFDMVQKAKVVQLRPGEILFKEGDEAKGFYILAEGQVELTSSFGVKKTFKEGDFFGELAILGGLKRTGQIQAIEEVNLIEFNKEELVTSFVTFPQMEERVLKHFYLRLFKAMTAKIKAFEIYDEAKLEEFFFTFEPRQAKPGEWICRKGEDIDEFFFTLSGSLEIIVEGQDPIEIFPSTFIGEIGFIEGKPRSADVKSRTVSHYLACQRYMFENFSRRFPNIVEVMKKVSEHRQEKNKNSALAS